MFRIPVLAVLRDARDPKNMIISEKFARNLEVAGRNHRYDHPCPPRLIQHLSRKAVAIHDTLPEALSAWASRIVNAVRGKESLSSQPSTVNDSQQIH